MSIVLSFASSARSGPGLTVTPANATVPPRGSITFSAAGVAPYVFSLATNNSGATIDATSGTYRAGMLGSSVDVVYVTDAVGQGATATVNVGPGMTMLPLGASVAPRQTMKFAATGGKGPYVWSLTAAPSGGHIDPALGVYVAGPRGLVLDGLRLVDSVGNTQEASVWVTSGVEIAPSLVSLSKGAHAHFTAGGGLGSGFTWSLAASESGGSIDAKTGEYRAGSRAGSDLVRVVDGLGNRADALALVVTSGDAGEETVDAGGDPHEPSPPSSPTPSDGGVGEGTFSPTGGCDCSFGAASRTAKGAQTPIFLAAAIAVARRRRRSARR